MTKIEIKTLANLEEAAHRILSITGNNRCLAFYGKMGAGKTTLIKSLCSVLGAIDVINSPSFAIVNEYNTKEGNKIFHFDFYRINRVEEVFDFGYEEYFYGDHYIFIEWPEKIENLLPPGCVSISLTETDNGSRIAEIHI